MSRLAALALGVAAVSATLVAPALAGSPFLVGFSEDLPKEIGSGAVAPAAELGGSAFRLTTLWTPGQIALTSEEAAKLDKAVAARAGQRYVLSVFADTGSKAPQDAAARDAYCAYVRTVLTRYPEIRDVVVWNEPNKSFFWAPQLDATGAPLAAERYTALLARCYDVLHAAFPSVNVVGLALSSTGNDNAGSASPGQFIRDVGVAYRASGRTAPLMDTVAHHPYGADAAERPWRKHIGSKTIALGDWNKLMYNLHLAFSGTGQSLPGQGTTALWYTEAGSQSAVPAEKAAAYNGTENVKTVPDYAGGEPDAPPPAETSPAPDLHTQAFDAIRLAACQPYVTAYFNFLLADEPRLAGWQSGALWADLTPKVSAGAFRSAFAEAASGTVSCDTLKGGRPSADYLPPAAPTGATATAATEPLRVVVSWIAATDETGVASYRVYRNGAHVGTTSETTWTNVSVQPGTTYSYVVRALDAAGNMGEASAAAVVTTPDTAPPSAPSALAAQPYAGPARVELTWPAATDNVGVTGYEILRDGVALGTVTGTTWTDGTVASVTTYEYAVVAFDGAGNRSARSPAATVTTLDTQAPTAPGSLLASVGSGRVDLSWTVATDDVGVTAYEVLRNGVQLSTVAGLSYADMSVSVGGSYSYAVRAVDAAGNRGPAATATATLPDTAAPTAPTGLRASSVDRTWIALAWSASVDNVGVAGYRVYRNGTLVRSVSGTSTTVTGLTRRTTYGFTVRAYDAAGNLGASSATLLVTTRR